MVKKNPEFMYRYSERRSVILVGSSHFVLASLASPTVTSESRLTSHRVFHVSVHRNAAHEGPHFLTHKQMRRSSASAESLRYN